MSKLITYLKIILVIALVAFLYGFAQFKNKQQKLTNIQIHFEEQQPRFLTKGGVEKILIKAIPNIKSKLIRKVNLNLLENTLQANKMIENVEVYATPKGMLHVNITQRVPIARLSANGKIFYMDRNGEDMPLSPNYSARVPLVTGVGSVADKAAVFQFIKTIEKDDFYKKQIIGIHKKINGDYLLSTRIGKHKILFGKFEDVADKLNKLQVFYSKEWETETINKYTLINLKYNNQVVCSK